MLDRATGGSDAEQKLVSDQAAFRPVAVEPRGGLRIWLRYSDGSTGEIDLSHLAGRGVFSAWDDPEYFKTVRLTEYDSIAWGDDLELCPDALYMKLTGKGLADVMSPPDSSGDCGSVYQSL